MTDYAELFSSIGWHQRWEIAPGIFTPGGNNVADLMDWTNVPQSLAGKRVLDIGAWNGCFSFEAERRGAAEVIAIGPEHPDNTGFTKLKEFLGSKVQYRLGSIYHLQPDEIGVFDVVLCFGVLYHLRYPLLGIDMVRRVARGTLHLETYAMPGEGPSMWEFYRKNELNNDASNWFGPNKTAIEEMLLSSGFDRVSVKSHPNNRASAFAHVSAGKPEWFSIGCGEGFYYDVITKPVLGSPDSY